MASVSPVVVVAVAAAVVVVSRVEERCSGSGAGNNTFSVVCLHRVDATPTVASARRCCTVGGNSSFLAATEQRMAGLFRAGDTRVDVQWVIDSERLGALHVLRP